MKVYEVQINGLPHTMQLSEEDAKRLNAKPVVTKQAAPANKARTVAGK